MTPTGPRAIPTLSRSRHDRAAARRDDEAWLADAWQSAKVLLISPAGTVPVRSAGAATNAAGSAAASGSALAWTGARDVDSTAQRLFLGEAEGTAYFAVTAAAQDDWAGLRDLGADLDELEAGLLTSAVALTQWHARHLHCPRCGALTVVTGAGWARRCPVDDSQHFPRTDPAVIMLVHDGGDRCVLGRQAIWPEGRYSILAGFVEAGESAEAAVAREVYEEAGLSIADIRYRSSQPWPFPASLMLGFTARAVGDLAVVRHDDELADAGWFTRAEVAAATTWPPAPPAPPPPTPPTAPTAATAAPTASRESSALTTSAARSASAATRHIGGEAERPSSRLEAVPGGVSIARFLIDEWLAAG